jgi:ERF superfamily
MNQEKSSNPLAEIQAKLKAPKGQFNSFGKYHYRSAEDILEAVKKVVNPMGFSIVLSDNIIFGNGRHYIKCVATLTNGELVYQATGFAREEETKKGMDGSQITGAASSYARKYALNGLFAIDDTKDSDATNDHGKSQESKPQAKTGMPSPSNFDIEFKELIADVKGVIAIGELKGIWEKLTDEAKANKEIQQLFNHRKAELSNQ